MTWGPAPRLKQAVLAELAESATRQSLARWSVSLISASFPAAPFEQILSLGLGQRDRLVMQIRSAHFGRDITAEPVCTRCAKTFSVTLRPDDIGLGPDMSAAAQGDFDIGGVVVPLRPVQLADLLAIDTVADPDTAASLLCERVGGAAARQIGTDRLAPVLEALDPAADIWISTSCPECGAAQDLSFDPVHFVAREIGYLVRQILQDVADIARVFHWSEADILAMSDQRRAFYLGEAVG